MGSKVVNQGSRLQHPELSVYHLYITFVRHALPYVLRTVGKMGSGIGKVLLVLILEWRFVVTEKLVLPHLVREATSKTTGASQRARAGNLSSWTRI